MRRRSFLRAAVGMAAAAAGVAKLTEQVEAHAPLPDANPTITATGTYGTVHTHPMPSYTQEELDALPAHTHPLFWEPRPMAGPVQVEMPQMTEEYLASLPAHDHSLVMAEPYEAWCETFVDGQADYTFQRLGGYLRLTDGDTVPLGKLRLEPFCAHFLGFHEETIKPSGDLVDW